MPIYEQGYRRWEARGPLSRLRFWPITREALRGILSKRPFLLLLFASFIPFLVRVGQIWIGTQMPQLGEMLPVDGRIFGGFLNGQIGFVVFLALFGGAALVADDLRCGAMLVYLSRPLTRRDYVLGKLGVVMTLGLSVTLLPGLVLYVAALGLAPEKFATFDKLWIGPALLLHSFVISLFVGLITLGISALTRSANLARLGLVGAWFGLHLVAAIAALTARVDRLTLLSPWSNLRSVGEALFRMSKVAWIDSALPVVCVAVLGGVALAILVSRVRAVEVVS